MSTATPDYTRYTDIRVTRPLNGGSSTACEIRDCKRQDAGIEVAVTVNGDRETLAICGHCHDALRSVFAPEPIDVSSNSPFYDD